MLIDLGKEPSARELRWFAGLWFPALCGMIGWLVWPHPGAPAVVYGAVAALLAMAGLARPRFIRPVYRALVLATFPIGWLVSHTMLRVVYFGVVTPIGQLVRLFTDPMTRAADPAAKTYWERRTTSAPERYFRQF